MPMQQNFETPPITQTILKQVFMHKLPGFYTGPFWNDEPPRDSGGEIFAS